MTIDTVVQKTGITLGLTILVAAATWVLTPDARHRRRPASLYLLAMVGAFGGFALSMVNSFKRVVSPALVLAYAALEGLFVGAFSKVIEAHVRRRHRASAPCSARSRRSAARSRRTSSSTSGQPDVPQVGRRRDVRLRRRRPARHGARPLRHASFGFNGFGADGPALQPHRPRPRRADADPRLRLRGARHRGRAARSASRGGRPSA